jgi:hypothetical protein
MAVNPLDRHDPDESNAVSPHSKANPVGSDPSAKRSGIRHRELIIALAARRYPPGHPYQLFNHQRRMISYGHTSDPLTRQATSIASSRARSRPICQYNNRPSSSWSSTSKLRGSLGSTRYSPAPTRIEWASRVRHAARRRAAWPLAGARGSRRCRSVISMPQRPMDLDFLRDASLKESATMSRVRTRRISLANNRPTYCQ